MQSRYENSPREVSSMDAGTLRANFLIDSLFQEDRIQWVYSHYDRMMIGGAISVKEALVLTTYDGLKSDYFLERRELGAINIGGPGKVTVDQQSWIVPTRGCIYLGMGTQSVSLESLDSENPATFYMLSAPAHAPHPNRMISKEEAAPMTVGGAETSNHRTIYKYIHNEGIQSCQLVMGLTDLSTGSVWNTMPSHVHDRRMEVYCYFNIPDGQRVLHLMGEPEETRHIWVANRQALISPPWSIHSGCGTSNYSFIWGMAGENKDYTDMDMIAIPDLR
ncbi:5-dehydro-4-deoxy-D-glucuronate isomerase [Dyadobacter tibetensis]|uniref:5-dehydro-4-deoxy-D-glucuronate isomerase n=1 Tax=Dyadobacter tibetensis TaxID=1211851 RepID=UPI00046EFE0D|nr:5-dehydro-4-deoxy-D-glucuronate isomerase [Dyadobacter tibetensis]